MKYRNKKTGAVIEIGSLLVGADWEAVEKQPPDKPTREPAKKKGDPE